MSKKSKMTQCSSCNAEILKKQKKCPSCGAKNKKPIYKRVWFILLIVIVLFTVAGKVKSNDTEKFKWVDDIEMSEILPAPESNRGKVYYNDLDSLLLDVNKISKEEYKAYKHECENYGFTIEKEDGDSGFNAYNKSGYKLRLQYNEDEEKMEINLDAPLKLTKLEWPPISKLAGMIPTPKSVNGKILTDSSEELSFYVGESSKDVYKSYVKECSEMGFDVEFNKGDDYYSAQNKDGYELSVYYEGNNVIKVVIEKTENVDDESSDFENQDNSNVTEEEEMVNGIRPEFKESMDELEDFFDEYCNFMSKYSEDDASLSMVADYTKFVKEYAEAMEKLEALGEEELNDEELTYYVKVQNRINEKLLDVAI